jgi:hypothetical protein
MKSIQLNKKNMTKKQTMETILYNNDYGILKFKKALIV